ncbi:MAG: hypothetical protein M3P00_13000 [Gemmatimonadota bacterium]|nr:hypothetical protein [Gemmatimonadota bacterium]
MKIAAFLTLGVAAYALPLIAVAQSLTPASRLTDSAPAVFAQARTNRAGISSEQLKSGHGPIAQSNADTSHVNVRAHFVYAFRGTLFGGLGGAAIGAGIGLLMDAHADSDAMIPASILLGYLGAIVGAGVGLIVGAFWPT